MSSFKKNTLAAALVLGMGLAGSAAAYTILTNNNATPESVATQSGSTFLMTEQVAIRTDLGDAVIGRTTGLQVMVTLEGAKFNTAVAPALTPGAAAVGWNAAWAAGGTTDTNIGQWHLEPQNPGDSIGAGIVGTFAAFSLKNAPGDVYATVQFIDPVTGTGLHTQRVQLVKRVDGIDFSCAANTNADKIDVGTNATLPATSAKTGVLRPPLADRRRRQRSGHQRTSGDYKSAVDILAFAFTGWPTDEFVSTIGGPNSFAWLHQRVPGDRQHCATNAGCRRRSIAGQTEAADAAATPWHRTWRGSVARPTTVVTVNGTTQIAAQQFTVLNGLNTLDTTEEVCSVAPIAYNGSVVRVYNINPAGNAQAQSFLRVINPFHHPRRAVTIVAWDDNGSNYRNWSCSPCRRTRVA